MSSFDFSTLPYVKKYTESEERYIEKIDKIVEKRSEMNKLFMISKLSQVEYKQQQSDERDRLRHAKIIKSKPGFYGNTRLPGKKWDADFEDKVWNNKDAYVNAAREYDLMVLDLLEFENAAKIIGYPLPPRHEEIIIDHKSNGLQRAERYMYFNKDGERCSQWDVEEEDVEDFDEDVEEEDEE